MNISAGESSVAEATKAVVESANMALKLASDGDTARAINFFVEGLSGKRSSCHYLVSVVLSSPFATHSGLHLGQALDFPFFFLCSVCGGSHDRYWVLVSFEQGLELAIRLSGPTHRRSWRIFATLVYALAHLH